MLNKNLEKKSVLPQLKQYNWVIVTISIPV